MFLTIKYYTIKFDSCMNKFPIKINLCSHNFYAFVWLRLTENFQVFQESTNRNAYIFDFFFGAISICNLNSYWALTSFKMSNQQEKGQMSMHLGQSRSSCTILGQADEMNKN